MWYSMRYATSPSNATRYGYLLAAGAILAVSSNNRKSGNRRQVSHCFTVSTRAREAGGGLLACCRREVKHIPTTRPHGDMEGYRQMLVMCMRCYTRVDMVKQCNRKAFARVRIKTGITSEANLPQAMALQGETANREILTWSLISLYAITERARTTKTGILDNRRIMSLSNFLQFIPLQGVWPPRTSVRFP